MLFSVNICPMRRVENQAGGQNYQESLQYGSVDECERFCEETQACVAAVYYSFGTCVWFDDMTNYQAETEAQATAILKECQDCKLI